MSRIRPKRATPRRRLAPRWTPEQWETATRALIYRSGSACERCRNPLTPHQAERHHRQKRTVGGDRLANLLYLCHKCHAWVTEHPTAATEAGLIVRSLGNPTPDPANIPVRLGRNGVWYLLDDTGHATILKERDSV